jgi:hypothetical protein
MEEVCIALEIATSLSSVDEISRPKEKRSKKLRGPSREE